MHIRWRAILTGLLLIPLNSFWIIQMEAVYYSAHSTTFSLFFNSVCSLLILLAGNSVLKKICYRYALNSAELITIFVMLNQGSALIGHSMLQILPATIAAPFGLATTENEWIELFASRIPSWLLVSESSALDSYITGEKSGSSLYLEDNFRAWLLPALTWSIFICLLIFIMFCINTIIRKHWMQNERLRFPVTQLPNEIINPQSLLFKNKFFWISCGTISLVNIVNGFHFFVPVVPSFRVVPYDLGALFTTKPWDAIGYMPFTVRPFLVGLIFLIPLDITFSCWVFFFYWKAQLVIGSALGQVQRPEFPEQSAGAYISLCVIAIWMAKKHIVMILKSLIVGPAGNLDSYQNAEPIEYRIAVIGGVIGFIFVLLFCFWAGMSIWVATLFFILYLMTAIGVTRVRAEVGSPIHDLHFAGPEYLIINLLGTKRLGLGNLSIFPFFWFLTRAHYSDVMPHQLEGFKLAHAAKGYNQRFLLALLSATVFGTVVAFWIILDSSYRHTEPVMSWAGNESFSRLARWISHPEPPNVQGIFLFFYGFLSGILIMFMRTQFLWWTLHPAGYAVSSTYGMRDYWSIFVLVWLIKWLILKIGGLKLHQRLLPIFYGLIIGEFAVGGFWALFGIVFRKQTFNFTAWW